MPLKETDLKKLVHIRQNYRGLESRNYILKAARLLNLKIEIGQVQSIEKGNTNEVSKDAIETYKKAVVKAFELMEKHNEEVLK